MNDVLRVRWQTFSGGTGWYTLYGRVEYTEAALVLHQVVDGKYRDEQLQPVAYRDIVVPWHVIRGLVEVVSGEVAE